MQTILITGGTGLIGKALTKHLIARGYKVIVLTRQEKSSTEIEYAEWDIQNQTIDIAAIQKADYIIHLAGAGVMDKRWTEAYKKEIVDSRTKSSELLVTTIKNNSNSVKAIISASAIGWYGPDTIPGSYFNEDYKANKSFLGETCRLWEESIEPVEQLGKRLVKLRTGIVLSNDGAAFVEFKKSLQLGVAAILGSGKQMISWIHIDDLCKLYIAAIENENLRGSYNAVTPEPVSNKQLIIALAKKIKGRFFIPIHAPAFMLKIILGEQSIEVLKSTTVSCNKIRQTGFVFLYPTLESALTELCKK